MRTTIDISDEQRAALLAFAARRGLRGYSLLVQEALARYLSLPMPTRSNLAQAAHGKKAESLVSFLCDGFATKRRDGSVRHDDYIYRGG